jgi:hypothetical protein
LISWTAVRKYLVKNKIFAATAFDLCGWKKDKYGADGDWKRCSIRNLELKLERMLVKMQLLRDGDGGLKLKKE